MPHPPGPHTVRIVTGPPEGGVFREAAAHLRRPFVAGFWRLRARWLLRRGVTRARRWWNPPGTNVLVAASFLLALVLLAWAVRGLLVVLLTDPPAKGNIPGWLWPEPETSCSQLGTSCGAFTGVLLPLLTLAASTVIFLVWRLSRVRRHCLRQARREPGRLVQTAGSMLGEVVGRDQLCNAVMNNLRTRSVRRPHVIVGKVGSGKTALMVHLTRRLAAKGAVPIPVRLRDVQKDELDFCRLARERFEKMVEPVVRSSGETDRAWRWLRQRADRIVVLADGLEEALTQDSLSGERDNLIRKAIRSAEEEELPLVIASRPHDPLRAMQAAVTELEPLSAEAALQYINRSGTWRSDPQLLDRVVEASNMVESPIYLRIAKELHRRNQLEPLWTDYVSDDLARHDLWSLREVLMARWMDSLVDGDIYPELPIDRDTRLAALEYISALACIGLAADRAEVELSELDPTVTDAPEATDAHVDGGHSPGRQSVEWNDRVAEKLDEQLALLRPGAGGPSGRPAGRRPAARSHVPENLLLAAVVTGATTDGDPPGGGRELPVTEPRMDVRLAVTWGRRMGIVNEYGKKVRFQHTLIQAYLGSRFLGRVLGTTPRNAHLRQLEQELRAREYTAGSARAGPMRPDPGQARSVAATAAGLRLPAPSPQDAHISRALRYGGRELLIALTLHSRSLEGRCTCGDRGANRPEPCPVVMLRRLLQQEARALLKEAEAAESMRWRREEGTGQDSRNRVTDDRGSPRLRALNIYGAAVEIDSVDDDPQQEELIREIGDNWLLFGRGEDPATLREAKLAAVHQCGAALGRVAAVRHRAPGYGPLFAIGRREPDYPVRQEISRQVGAGGECAYREVYEGLKKPVPVLEDLRPPEPPGDGFRPPPSTDQEQEDRGHQMLLRRWERQRRKEREERRRAEWENAREKVNWYHDTLYAWVLPMLVDTAGMSRYSGSPRNDLERWTARATSAAGSEPGGLGPGAGCGLGLALAQGFKYAANRRPGRTSDGEAREFLIKNARELLQRSRYWYTRLTLLQALTLWALPDDVTQDQQIRGPGADPRGEVHEWLATTDDRPEHKLVEAAAGLAVRALQTRNPGRFLWIDEESVVAEVGTVVSRPAQARYHNQWIPPSTGWSTLDPTAQQLLADVLLLAMLEERRYGPRDLLCVLEHGTTAQPRLPSCLSRDRSRLDPLRAVNRYAQPGDNCTDECRLKMCPYPDKAEGLRVEFDEVFCLRQLDLLRAWRPREWAYLRFRREARWQRGVPVAGMRRFWQQMGDRARDVSPEDWQPLRDNLVRR